MKPLCSLASVFALALPAAAETLYFAEETPAESTRVALTIEGEEVYGIQIRQPGGEVHGARGSLTGKIRGGVIRALYEYSVEGSDQSEEVAFKLENDRLLVGEGELVEGEGGVLRLKNAAKVTFPKALRRVPVVEPKPGSPERKAIMDAMRGPVSAHVGKAVQFTGEVRAHRGWAAFSGNVASADGKMPADEGVAFELDLDFFSLLKQDPEGNWQVLHWGFSGDTGVMDEALSRFPQVPWVLLH